MQIICFDGLGRVHVNGDLCLRGIKEGGEWMIVNSSLSLGCFLAIVVLYLLL